MSIEVFNNPGVAHAVGNSTGAVSVSGDTIIETDTSPENELARAIPGLTKYMIEWKSPKSPESESEARHTDGAMPQVFDPEQALRDYANGAFLNASSFTELPQPGLNPNPLRGLPSRFTIDGEPIDFGPNLRIRRASETYCRLAGIPVRFPIVYAKLDKVRSTAIAHLYEDMIPTPQTLQPKLRIGPSAPRPLLSGKQSKPRGSTSNMNLMPLIDRTPTLAKPSSTYITTTTSSSRPPAPPTGMSPSSRTRTILSLSRRPSKSPACLP